MLLSVFMQCIHSGTLMFHPCSTIFMFVKQMYKRKVIEHRCSTVPLKKALMRVSHCATAHKLLDLAPLRIADRPLSLVGVVVRCSTLLVNKLHITSHVLHPDVGDQSGSLARTALYTQSSHHRIPNDQHWFKGMST